MEEYIKLFQNHTLYETYKSSANYVTPNVSYCEDLNEVHYNPWVDTRLVAIFNVISTSESTTICDSTATSEFSKIEIDGVIQPSVVSEYTFNTTGEHIVKYTLADLTRVGSNFFKNCGNLTSVIIPDGVTNINYQAFYGCTNLISITIPNSVTTIANRVFQNCSNLISVTIPSGVASIDSNTFSGCSSLTSVVIPDNVTTIGESAFNRCSSLTSINIPSGVTSIGRFVFNSCSSLTSCTIGNGIVSIGDGAFQSCSGLTSVTVEAATLPTLGVGVFYDTNNCPIYVPAASVNAYKAATNWSDYASRIQAIPTT